jgi:hypothetical protein
MLEHAWEQGVPMRWVTGDSVYGDSPDLRAAIQAHGGWYVLALTSVIRCWLEPPPLEEPQEETGGRPRRAVRLAKGAPKAQPVAEVIARLPRAQWKRLSIATGTKGPRVYDWARVRVIESRDGFPGPEVWLLARRSVSDPTELAYYFAYAPPTSSLLTLAPVAGTRYTVEQVIKEAKAARWDSTAMRSGIGTVGIATSRSRCWPRSGSPTSGWWREKKTGLEDLTVPEVRRLLEVALPVASAGRP